LLYLDLAGFGDTRGIEERIAISVLTDNAIKKMKSIHSIVVVISIEEFTASRGT
jgi:hypothetical protein